MLTPVQLAVIGGNEYSFTTEDPFAPQRSKKPKPWLTKKYALLWSKAEGAGSLRNTKGMQGIVYLADDNHRRKSL
jgi:hypothetical protein